MTCVHRWGMCHYVPDGHGYHLETWDMSFCVFGLQGPCDEGCPKYREKGKGDKPPE